MTEPQSRTRLPAARVTSHRLRRFGGFVIAAIALTALALPAPAAAQGSTRIKDIVNFEGVRTNQLIGYGLVVGLNGTGDDLRNNEFTRQSLVGMLERLGVNTRDANGNTTTVDPENVAAVMVTATLPPFARHGSRIDVAVAALGDASSLAGGTLIVTPLMGADGEVYAVAQGPVAVGGFRVQGQAQQVSRGIPTAGVLANGAVVEREVQFDLASLESVRLALRNPDLTTARRIANAVNAFLSQPAARATDPGTVQVQVPPTYRGDVVSLLTDIEQLRVDPDQLAKVVIDESNGIIVMGENVRISTVAVAQGNLTVRITEEPQVSQPGAFAPEGAQTVVTPRTNIEVDEEQERRLGIVAGGITLQDLVNGLNSLGIGPRDMISILQAVKAAGALQAEMEIR